MSVLFQDNISGVNLLLLSSMKIKFKFISFDILMKRLNDYYYFLEWKEDSDYASCFKEFQNFLFKENLSQEENLKIKLGTLDLIIDSYPEQRRIATEVLLFIYPGIDIVNILFNFSLENITVDELIHIRKTIQFDKKPITLHNNGFFKHCKEFMKINFSDISKIIGKSLIEISDYRRYPVRFYISGLKRLQLTYDKEAFCESAYQKLYKQKQVVVEIRQIEGLESERLKALDYNDHYAKMIYGMLTCDEGYSFVPAKTIANALEDHFTSRDYFKVFATNIGVLMINLVNSELQRNYEDYQKQLSTVFQYNNEKLFCSHPVYAGLEHGALLALERTTMLFVIINSNMQKEYFTSKRRILTIIRNRQKMVEIINLVMSFNINEISTLTDVIMRKNGIFQYVDRVRERLDIAEDDTLIVYQKWNNAFTLTIALIGVIFAAMSISELKNIIITFFTSLFGS